MLQMDVFPYSVFYIFFEQYLDIWRIALVNIFIALGWYSWTSNWQYFISVCMYT